MSRRRKGPKVFDRRHAHCTCVCPRCGAGFGPGRSEFKKDLSGYICGCGAVVPVIYVSSLRGWSYDLSDPRLAGRRLSPFGPADTADPVATDDIPNEVDFA